MKAVDNGQAKALQPGQTWVLPGGASLTYVDTAQWANLQVTQDPSRTVMLVAAIGIVGGLMLSLFVRRRPPCFPADPHSSSTASFCFRSIP